ncbi:MAG TPA: hypothetical protein PLZ79_06425 [Burkholderiales bacterium]|nr:hypothetical protein [Burkholderiales bacterium]
MSLIELAVKEPEKFATKTVEQIVHICGDGRLKDGSEASAEFRQFLTQQSSAKLAEYARYCLENSFERGGFVLQDVVNEIGKRLGYKVSNGLYQGKSNAIGFDGIWDDGVTELVVEIKTTDVYRINLDTVFGYGEKLKVNDGGSEKTRNCLIVVGRQDTGGLEAQVRGSRYAWSVRLISVDALIKLMFVNEEVDDINLVKKIRQTLLPIEYTRVDHIVDLVFETQQEQAPADKESTVEAEEKNGDGQKHGFVFTPKAELDAKRLACVAAFFKSKGLTFERKTKTAFSDPSGNTRAICAISKRYEGTYQPYWYAIHPHWMQFIEEGKSGFVILGGMDADEAYAIPVDQVKPLLPKLNQTVKEDSGRNYWHLAITQIGGDLYINLSKVGEKFKLTPYRFPI